MVQTRRYNLLVVLLIIWFCVVAVSAKSANDTVSSNTTVTSEPTPSLQEIRRFTPDSGSIQSTDVYEAINGRNGSVLFATSYGLSEFQGTWTTRHLIGGGDINRGLLDDFITALEYDASGNLWIGYAEGIQIDNGTGRYKVIRDQQLLKSLRIKALQRWGDAMWVATGNAGIHRFENGSWTWFKPMSKDGPGFYEIDSMVLDPRSDSLLIATENTGVWRVSSKYDPIRFERIDVQGRETSRIFHARQNPLGGAYFFDTDSVLGYSPESGLEKILSITDLTQGTNVINDIAASPDGTLFVGTDDGIYVQRDGTVVRHLSRYEGIGTSAVVTWLFLDAENRLWFATQSCVGYYYGEYTFLPVIPVQIVNQSLSETPVTETIPVSTTVATQVPSITNTPGTVIAKEPTILERIIAFISGLLPRLS